MPKETPGESGGTVDAADSKSADASRVGSNPSSRTTGKTGISLGTNMLFQRIKDPRRRVLLQWRAAFGGAVVLLASAYGLISLFGGPKLLLSFCFTLLALNIFGFIYTFVGL